MRRETRLECGCVVRCNHDAISGVPVDIVAVVWCPTHGNMDEVLEMLKAWHVAIEERDWTGLEYTDEDDGALIRAEDLTMDLYAKMCAGGHA